MATGGLELGLGFGLGLGVMFGLGLGLEHLEVGLAALGHISTNQADSAGLAFIRVRVRVRVRARLRVRVRVRVRVRIRDFCVSLS